MTRIDKRDVRKLRRLSIKNQPKNRRAVLVAAISEYA